MVANILKCINSNDADNFLKIHWGDKSLEIGGFTEVGAIVSLIVAGLFFTINFLAFLWLS